MADEKEKKPLKKRPSKGTAIEDGEKEKIKPGEDDQEAKKEKPEDESKEDQDDEKSDKDEKDSGDKPEDDKGPNDKPKPKPADDSEKDGGEPDDESSDKGEATPKKKPLAKRPAQKPADKADGEEGEAKGGEEAKAAPEPEVDLPSSEQLKKEYEAKKKKREANDEAKSPEERAKEEKEERGKNPYIEIEPDMEEGPLKETVVVTWGRMNPITAGHEKLVEQMKTVAENVNGEVKIYLSHSRDSEKNPLTYDQKVDFAESAFGPVIQRSEARNIIPMLKELSESYKNVIAVVGEDRVADFDRILNTYNGKDFVFETVYVISAGHRDPNVSGLEGLSATKLREAAAEDDYTTFLWSVPDTLIERAEEMYNCVREGMGLQMSENIEEQVLSRADRMKRAMTLRKHKAKILAGRKRAMRKKPNKETLEKRAQKRAISQVRDSLTPDDKSYKDLEAGERALVDKKVRKRGQMIARIARKLVPQMRKEDVDLVETPTKRFHEMRNKDGSIKTDRRFRAFKKKKKPIEELAQTMVGSEKQQQALEERAQNAGLPVETIMEVFDRGILEWVEGTNQKLTAEQAAFNRVDSFIAGGRAAELDADLLGDE